VCPGCDTRTALKIRIFSRITPVNTHVYAFGVWAPGAVWLYDVSRAFLVTNQKVCEAHYLERSGICARGLPWQLRSFRRRATLLWLQCAVLFDAYRVRVLCLWHLGGLWTLVFAFIQSLTVSGCFVPVYCVCFCYCLVCASVELKQNIIIFRVLFYETALHSFYPSLRLGRNIRKWTEVPSYKPSSLNSLHLPWHIGSGL